MQFESRGSVLCPLTLSQLSSDSKPLPLSLLNEKMNTHRHIALGLQTYHLGEHVTVSYQQDSLFSTVNMHHNSHLFTLFEKKKSNNLIASFIPCTGDHWETETFQFQLLSSSKFDSFSQAPGLRHTWAPIQRRVAAYSMSDRPQSVFNPLDPKIATSHTSCHHLYTLLLTSADQFRINQNKSCAELGGWVQKPASLLTLSERYCNHLRKYNATWTHLTLKKLQDVSTLLLESQADPS